MDTVHYLLPAHWASALFNGDETGYEEDDLEAMEAFEDYMLEEHGSCEAVEMEDDGFSYHHDASCYGVGGCDVARYTFIVRN